MVRVSVQISVSHKHRFLDHESTVYAICKRSFSLPLLCGWHPKLRRYTQFLLRYNRIYVCIMTKEKWIDPLTKLMSKTIQLDINELKMPETDLLLTKVFNIYINSIIRFSHQWILKKSALFMLCNLDLNKGN